MSVLVNGKYVEQSYLDYLEGLYAEYIRLNPNMAGSADVVPSPGQPVKVELTGTLSTLMIDAWAWHWRATHKVVYKHGRTYILFTAMETEPA